MAEDGEHHRRVIAEGETRKTNYLELFNSINFY